MLKDLCPDIIPEILDYCHPIQQLPLYSLLSTKQQQVCDNLISAHIFPVRTIPAHLMTPHYLHWIDRIRKFRYSEGVEIITRIIRYNKMNTIKWAVYRFPIIREHVIVAIRANRLRMLQYLHKKPTTTIIFPEYIDNILEIALNCGNLEIVQWIYKIGYLVDDSILIIFLKYNQRNPKYRAICDWISKF